MTSDMTLGLYDKLVIPKEYAVISISAAEAEYIYSFLKEKGIKKTLEIGLAFGCSAVHIISATQHQHYAIDPFQDKFKQAGLNNVKDLGLDKYLVFEKDYSFNVLPKYLENGSTFDFIFIDGDHKFDFAFVDFFYADRLLNQKGYILFHDSWMPALRGVASWIKNNRKDYSFVETPQNNLILVQKNGTDDRSWDHYEGFKSMKSKVGNMFDRIVRRKGRVSFLKR